MGGAMGDQQILAIFTEIIYWSPWIPQVQSLGLPSNFLSAQPCVLFFLSSLLLKYHL